MNFFNCVNNLKVNVYNETFSKKKLFRYSYKYYVLMTVAMEMKTIDSELYIAPIYIYLRYIMLLMRHFFCVRG